MSVKTVNTIMSTTNKKIHKAVLTIEVEIVVDEQENWSLDELDEMIGDALEAGSRAVDREVEFDFMTCSISHDE
jgi:hypothetical protein